jgi:hypothetical protein
MNCSALQKCFLSAKYKFELVYRNNCYTIVAIIYIIHGFSRTGQSIINIPCQYPGQQHLVTK